MVHLGVSTLISHRINSCLVFAEGECPHKLTMERVYIISHLMDPDEKRKAQSKCLECERYTKVRYYPTGLEIDDLYSTKKDNDYGFTWSMK